MKDVAEVKAEGFREGIQAAIHRIERALEAGRERGKSQLKIADSVVPMDAAKYAHMAAEEFSGADALGRIRVELLGMRNGGAR